MRFSRSPPAVLSICSPRPARAKSCAVRTSVSIPPIFRGENEDGDRSETRTETGKAR